MLALMPLWSVSIHGCLPEGRRYGLLLLCLLLVTGCASVSVSTLDSRDYVKQRRGDVLTTGELSLYTGSVLQILGQDERVCRRQAGVCAGILSSAIGLNTEQRLSTMAELWLYQALLLSKPPYQDQFGEITAYLQTAKYAYAYLFYSGVRPNNRLFTDRQTQVRDYYNFAVQQVTILLFTRPEQNWISQPDLALNHLDWQIFSEIKHQRLAVQSLPVKMVATSSLSFKGLRNQYRRDGLGAELVADLQLYRLVPAQQPFSKLPLPVVTALITFKGDTLNEVLQSQHASIHLLDPLQQRSIHIAGNQVPLAANFTAGYGLWLARSDFSRQAFWNLMGARDALAEPHVFLLQPFDPERKIIILLHGIASSPEAWVNTANEILGDETLREHYQIWQIYYPTNLPLVLNVQSIRQVIQTTFAHFDAEATTKAAKDMVLIGHSMGGVLARLLVTDSGDTILQSISQQRHLDAQRRRQFYQRFREDLTLTALPGVSRAVFIAAPHQGTSVADHRLARWLAGLITLPLTVLERFAHATELLADPENQDKKRAVRFTSIENLSENDLFIRVAAKLPINPAVRYHSIIGVEQPNLPLEQQSDGVVPYLSASLAGAESEMVIRSGHSVQETSAAILEIRRILYQHLTELPD